MDEDLSMGTPGLKASWRIAAFSGLKAAAPSAPCCSLRNPQLPPHFKFIWDGVVRG